MIILFKQEIFDNIPGKGCNLDEWNSFYEGCKCKNNNELLSNYNNNNNNNNNDHDHDHVRQDIHIKLSKNYDNVYNIYTK